MTKTFIKLSIGDTLYQLIDNQIVPKIEKITVNSLSKMNYGDPLRVHFNSASFKVPNEEIDSNKSGPFFLNKEDCEKSLEELCLRRIVSLSKAIGATS